MDIYYIYEIPGVKVGCTKDLKYRVEWVQKIPLGQYKVLGAANNIDDAAILEAEWQQKLGYRSEPGYKQALKWQQSGQTKQARTKARTNTDYSSFQSKRVANKQKAILQYDLQMNFIQEWPSFKHVESALQIFATSIRKCIRGEHKHAGGYLWRYK